MMLREILDQPRLASVELSRLRSEAAVAVRTLARTPSRLILTGCGDSLIAGRALEPAARALNRPGRAVHALPSLEAARYFPFHSGDLLIACSVSGEVARTLDAVEAARRAGGSVLGVLARTASTLARLSDAVVRLPEPMARTTPHSRDYLATLLAIGALLEALDGHTIPALDAAGPLIGAHMADWQRRARELSADFAHAARLFFLGAGPSWGAAMYGAAKLWEAGGVLALAQELEEFAHGEHMLAQEGDGLVVVAPPGPGSERTGQMLEGFLQLGLHIQFMGQPSRALVGVDVWPLPDFPELWSPLLTAVPLQLLCYELAGARGLDVEQPLGGRPGGEIFEAVHLAWTRGGR
ncbi:MAG: SIS domain-containing protein [Chloroflexi bacterium]|nr:SIS domain-containing protein [Chloroflexota bacterium]